jgi:hypothetical protein
MKKNTTYMHKIVGSVIFMALIAFVFTAQSTALQVFAASTTSSTSSSNSSNGSNKGPEWGTIPRQECTQEQRSRDTLNGQVLQLQAEIDANTKGADALDAETNRYKKLLGIGTSTSATSTTATSTTATSTSGTSAFSLTVSPTSVRAGESFTMNVNVNSTSVTKYSVNVYQGSTLMGTLLSGAAVDGSSRPKSIEKVFRISTDTPVGNYVVKIVDDNNSSNYQTAYLYVVAPQFNATSANTNTTGSGFTNTSSTNSTGSTGLTSVVFSNPFPYGVLSRDKNVQITWSAQGNTNSMVNLYLQTSCVKTVPLCTQYNPSNPTSSCVTIKSSCKSGSGTVTPISAVSASAQSYNWVVPHNLVDSVGVIYAEQNGQRIGTTGSFYISY